MSSLYNKTKLQHARTHFKFRPIMKMIFFKNEKVLNLRLMHENCEKKYFKKSIKIPKKISSMMIVLLYCLNAVLITYYVLIIVYNLVRLSPRASIIR